MHDNKAENTPDQSGQQIETKPTEHSGQKKATTYKRILVPLALVLAFVVAAAAFTTNFAGNRSAAPNKELSSEDKYWQRVFAKAFEPVDCPNPRDPNSLPDSYYKGPMIDTHVHIESLPDGDPGYADEYYSQDNMGIGRSITEWICMMDSEGTKQAWGFFPVLGRYIDESVDLAESTLKRHPNRFIPFLGAPGNDVKYPTVDATELERMLQASPGLFRGWGEVGLYARGREGPALPPGSPRLKEIYPLIRANKLVVYFHLGEGQKESFERVLKANRDINFVFHGDQLIECEDCPKNLDLIADLLEEHPNVYYGVDQIYGNIWLLRPDEISKDEFIAHFSDYKRLLNIDLHNWKGFIEKFPDQVLWGTDRGFRWSTDPAVALALNDYTRAFIGKLDPTVQEKFAYKNAENLMSGNATKRAPIVRGRGNLPDGIKHIEAE